ncbi:PDZ domain-containing protein 8 [Thrips palmi]|uniref:PDZ domain-containing protein 8 n=1 Tax=Thrips palmi TaxID=161013 RepID=A0A6P8ZJD2_THRPL|nr:PDZ domain-containing protein 8 [Thrips palmi]XP_034235150.1 PDZ domain-containing protein 8 [Thrips palmi]XP_034235151.1 PDZ domain-containing protein 8 [Thrips palmi]XP_034235152.1 PDZ domain-containing protein 8 [Thrips palmi]
MDLILMLLCMLVGAVAVLAAEWYIFQRFLLSQPEVEPPKQPFAVSAPFCLPKHILDALQNRNLSKQESCLGISLLLQFLFQELRHTERVRNWFHRKLSLEFEELLTRTTTGKLFDFIAVRDLNLGSHFPTIRSVEVRQVSQDPVHHRIDTLELCLDIHYSGSFQLSLDANLVLGRAAYLSVTVHELVGMARLQFTRLPYTHWSISFYSEPVLQLEVESQFQGRPLPQITNIIVNQIRKSLKRKHTLPNFKLRYKPFFAKSEPGDEEAEWGQHSVQSGSLEVTVVEVTRLASLGNGTENIYCSLAIDRTAWVEMVHSDTSTYMTLDVSIVKSPQQQLGIVFRQEFVADRYQACVIVDTVLPGSPASNSDVQPGDLLTAVDGKRISTIAQAAKCMKGAGDKYTLRLERKVAFNTSSPTSTSETDSTVIRPSNVTVSVTKDSPTLDRTGLRKRRVSVEQSDYVDSDSSTSSPANSTQSSPAKKPAAMFPGPSNSSSTPGSTPGSAGGSISPSPDHRNKQQAPGDQGNLQMLNTKEIPLDQVLDFNETLKFAVGPHHRYLNISVWSARTGPGGRDQLLGHVSVLLAAVADQCSRSRLGHFISSYSFLPPDLHLANSQSHKLSNHSGFEPCLCYGDVLLSFMYMTPNGTQSPSPPFPSGSPSHQSTEPTVSSVTSQDAGVFRSHDFIRTQFHRAIQCGFCMKKIWLKDAVQCRTCGMSCHKKCINKCMAGSSCGGAPPQSGITVPSKPSAGNSPASRKAHRHSLGEADVAGAFTDQRNLAAGSSHNLGDGDSASQPRRASIHPEIVMTSAEEAANIPIQGPSHRKRITNLLASMATQARGLKRVGSAHNLAPPGSDGSQGAGHLSRSLPPSPQHSPAPSRKTSLHETVFQFSELDSGSDEDASADEDVSVALEQLLQLRRPTGSGGAAGAGDDGSEDLMAVAKATGKELYSGLPPTQRIERINKMITKLKTSMDSESTLRMQLAREEGDCQDTAEKTRLAFLIGKCDEKVQALAILMLHFCAGLQHTQDQEEQLQKQASNQSGVTAPGSSENLK